MNSEERRIYAKKVMDEMRAEKASIRKKDTSVDPVSDYLTQGAEAELRAMCRILLLGIGRRLR